MSERDLSDTATGTRAWQMLRTAHDRVVQRLGAELSRECALAINGFDVLLYLRSHARDEVRISALLAAVSLSEPALSRLAERLEGRGPLARSGAEGDGRAIIVCLTEMGTVLIDRAIAIHVRAVHETLTSKVSDTEQAALLQTLSQIGK